ncbi:MAG: P-type conjugative transfer ATPase TrbB, partial [Gammaproteobacteria bacterium]|nr:P-type conjugative transfer ATPase TrbB [Gammaproteobacteria bacterium]
MSDGVMKDRYLAMLETAFGEEIITLMNDDQVIEVMLNPDGQLWVERLFEGKRNTGIKIPTTRSENIIKLVASYKNDVASTESPMVSTEIPIGSARFQG